jgi:chromosome segregation ATPase
MIDKLKDNLASIAALIAAVVAIGGGFVKYGEITTKLNNIEANQGVDFAPIEKQIDELKERIDGLSGAIGKNKSATNDVNTKAQVNEKEIQLLKLQIQEIQIKSSNPLGG